MDVASYEAGKICR